MKKNQLIWASRRGMLELDLVLMPFVESAYSGLGIEDQQRFETLLDEEDQDLFAWFLGRQRPESADLQRIVDIVLEFSREKTT